MAIISFNFYSIFWSVAISPKSPKEFFLTSLPRPPSLPTDQQNVTEGTGGQLTLISRFATILRGDELWCVHTPSLQASFPYLPPSIPSPLTGRDRVAIFTMIFARLVIFNYATLRGLFISGITKSQSFATSRIIEAIITRIIGFRLKADVVIDGSGSRSRNRCRVAISLTYTRSLYFVLSFFLLASNSSFCLSRKALVFSCSFGLVFIKLFDAVRSFVKHDILEFSLDLCNVCNNYMEFSLL